MSPDPHEHPEHTDPEHHGEDDEHDEHVQREIDPDAPGAWIDDPEGDAPEPNEPA